MTAVSGGHAVAAFQNSPHDRSAAASAPAGSPPLTEHSGPRATILVVEDEPLVRMAVCHYLLAAGYSVLSASDGGSAIERSEGYAGAIELVLTDLSLPDGYSGLQIVERIRTTRPRVSAVYMSAYPPELLSRRGFVLPAGGALEKPFTKQALLSRIERELSARDP